MVDAQVVETRAEGKGEVVEHLGLIAADLGALGSNREGQGWKK